MSNHLETLLAHAAREARRAIICARCRRCEKPVGDLRRASLLAFCAMDMASSDPRPYAIAAQVYLALDELDNALLAFRKLATYSPNPVPALLEIAAIHLARRRLSRAYLWVSRALELNPCLAARALAAQICATMGQWQEELAHWRAAVAREPENPAATYGLGLAQLAHGDPEQACRALQRVLGLRPAGFRRAHFYLGCALAACGRWAEACAAFAQAAQREPSWAAAAHALGFSLLEAGRPREALAPLRRAAQLDPNNGCYAADLARAARHAAEPRSSPSAGA